MPRTDTDQPYRKLIEFRAEARWSSDVLPSQDAAARPFAGSKSVLYIPVKKQNGEEKIPTLGIHVLLLERNRVRNVSVPGHAGARVEVRVLNVWKNLRAGPSQWEGSLDEKGECLIAVPAANVKKWLDPNGELSGRVNELLLDFEFSIRSLRTDDAGPLEGESAMRVYLYRRKTIVFLPGVFGSQISLPLPDGRVLGFPDFYDEVLARNVRVEPLNPTTDLLPQLAELVNQKIGGLECDAAGRPLLSPIKPTLIRLGGLVNDVFDRCHAERRRYFSGVPADFRLIELQVFAYDWRTDLTEAAQALAKRLAELQTSLRAKADTDDEIAVAGHSTGGLILRRALGEPGLQQIVSQAFFISVPFQGAPKALSVILTGKDPAGGSAVNRMILFINADSLRDLALSMPIVYHLAPSAAYVQQVAFSPSGPTGFGGAVEDAKRELIDGAIAAGFLPRPRFVKASGLSDAERLQLAATSDSWHSYWDEVSERRRSQDLYDAMYPHGHPEREAWFAAQLTSRHLEAQAAARVPGGWNTELAARAKQFHKESEAIATSGAWADKAYVFYSKTKGPTTFSVQLQRESEADFSGPISLLDAENIGVLRFLEGDVVPLRSEDEQIVTGDGAPHAVPAPVVHQWATVDGKCRRTVWRLWAESTLGGGDGTVPEESLLGFGGKAHLQYVGAAEESVNHINSPQHETVWDSIMHMLQGTWVPSMAPPTTASDGPLR